MNTNDTCQIHIILSLIVKSFFEVTWTFIKVYKQTLTMQSILTLLHFIFPYKICKSIRIDYFGKWERNRSIFGFYICTIAINSYNLSTHKRMISSSTQPIIMWVLPLLSWPYANIVIVYKLCIMSCMVQLMLYLWLKWDFIYYQYCAAYITSIYTVPENNKTNLLLLDYSEASKYLASFLNNVN